LQDCYCYSCSKQAPKVRGKRHRRNKSDCSCCYRGLWLSSWGLANLQVTVTACSQRRDIQAAFQCWRRGCGWMVFCSRLSNIHRWML